MRSAEAEDKTVDRLGVYDKKDAKGQELWTAYYPPVRVIYQLRWISIGAVNTILDNEVYDCSIVEYEKRITE